MWEWMPPATRFPDGADPVRVAAMRAAAGRHLPVWAPDIRGNGLLGSPRATLGRERSCGLRRPHKSGYALDDAERLEKDAGPKLAAEILI
jgi:hypothetical protein